MKRIIAFVSLLFTGLLYIPCFAQTRLAGDYGFSWGDDDNYRYYRRRIGDSVWIDTRGSFNKVIDIPGGTTGAFSVNWQELRYVYLTTDSLFTPVCIESSNPDVISVEVISDSTVVKDYFGKAWHATVYALSFKTEGSAVISMVDKRGYSAEDKWYVAVYESTGIELEYVGNTSIGIGETLKMNARTLPEFASYPLECSWESSAPGVAGVSASGLVTGFSEGEAKITVRSGDYSADATVNVSPVPAQSVYIRYGDNNISSITLLEKDTIQLTAYVLPENTTDKSVTWSSADINVATVSENGLVTAIKGNTASDGLGTTITATTLNGKKCNVSVRVKQITVDMESYDDIMTVGKTQQLSVSLNPDTAVTKVSWTSSDPEYLSVDSTGMVTALKYGPDSYRITATLENGNSASADISIDPGCQVETVWLESDDSRAAFVSSSELNVTMDKGDSVRINVLLLPWMAENKKIAVTAGNDNVARVKGLVSDPDSASCRAYHFYVEGVGSGNTAIQVTAESVYGNPSAKLNVVVSNPVYTVRFVDWDGKELSVERIEEGSAATAPSVQSARPDYLFIGWDKSFDSVMSDMTVTAQYKISDDVKNRTHAHINLTEAGTLKSRLLYDTDFDRVDSLTVSGLFNGYDLLYIRSMEGLLAKLIYLDLTEIQVVNSDAVYYESPYEFDMVGNPVAWFCFMLSDTCYDETVHNSSVFYSDVYIHRDDFRYAFTGMNTIREIRLPSFLKYYAGSLFSGCSSLTKVVFSGSPESIEPNAFSGTALTEMVIPASVKEIGDGAFSGCTSLVCVKAEKVETVGGYAFSGCRELESADFGDNVKQYGPSCFSNCAFAGFNVSVLASEICESMFWGCSNLKGIRLPESIRSIGSGAFYECTNLQSVSMSDSVTYIGDKAFYNCSDLTEMTLSAGVLNVGSDAFFKNPWLEQIRFDNYVKYIGPIAYQADKEAIYNSGIKSITIKEGTTALGKELFDNCGLTSIELPSSLKSIGECSLSGNAFSSLTLPDELEIIGFSAFADCSELTSLTIPEKVRFIGNTAFGGCTSLVRFTYNAENADIYKYEFGVDEKQVLDWSYDVLPGNLVRVKIGDKVKKIPVSLFNGCTNLGRFEMGANVEEIEKYAFQSCSALNAVDLSNVKIIGESAFLGCPLESVDLSSAQETGSYAFWKNQSLTSLKLGGNVGDYAFERCQNLPEVEVLPTVKIIGHNAFYDCASITRADLSGVEEIGYDAFGKCYALKDVVSLANVRKVDYNAFAGCALTDVDLSNADSIGSYAFSENTSLVSAKLNGVIGEGAFYGCYSLAEVDMNDNIREIGAKAFYGCSSLPVYDYVIYAGKYAVEALTYATEYTVREGTIWIGEEAFKDCNYAVSINLPQSLRYIGASAFENCSSLISADVPDSVDYLGEKAFSGCSSLKNLKLSDKVDIIRESTFNGCVSLDSVVIPNGVTEIGLGAFRNCSGLEYVVFPEKLERIGSNAFRGCSLKDVYCFAKDVPFASSNSMFIVIVFDNISEAVLHVPAESVEDYSYTTPWNGFGCITAITADEYGLGVKPVMRQDAKIRKVFMDGRMIIVTPDGRKFNQAGQELR